MNALNQRAEAAASRRRRGRAERSARCRARACDADVERWSWRHHQPVADAAHGLHDQRIGRIALDLAAQAVDLHVDRALADRSRRCRQAPCAAPFRPASGASTRSISRSRSVRWTISSPRCAARRARCETRTRRSARDLGRRRRGRLRAPAGCWRCAATARAARTAWRHNRRRRSRALSMRLSVSSRAVSIRIGTLEVCADGRARTRSRSRPASSRRGSADRSSGLRAWRAHRPRVSAVVTR